MNWYKYNQLTRAIIVLQNLILKYKKNPEKVKELSTISEYWYNERENLKIPYKRLTNEEYCQLEMF